MTKLDGNERWQNKMLLTDHVEQYEQKKREEGTENKRLTVDEHTMVRDLIVLSHLCTMLDNGLRELEQIKGILKRAALQAGKAVQLQIDKDMYRMRKELKQRNIRYIVDDQDDFILNHTIFCRGYQTQFGLTRDVVRTEISLQLTRYTSEISLALKEHFK